MSRKTIALIGARGHVGCELMRLLVEHPGFELAWASSRQKQGQPIAKDVPGMRGHYCLIEPQNLAEHLADVYVLALPNGLAETWVAAIDDHHPNAIILDLSADYRFNSQWTYGLTEINRAAISTARRISNPGCYATAMQLALHPLLPLGISNIHCFGVSGYSGAGTTPSPNNDPQQLQDNLKAYKLTDHVHEREVSHQLQQPVHFMPSVAGFFRGIQMTVSCTLQQAQGPLKQDQINACFETYYQQEACVLTGQNIPEIKEVRETPLCSIGGATLSMDGQRLVLISVLDNLLKGAASQAIQNLNLACGFYECEGLSNGR